MNPPTYQPLVHRTAVATTVAALLPIAVGALVTTMGAGMAFRDWPNSDGHFMLTYPWLADLFRGAMNKFVEHGHRLAGTFIGLMSIGLLAVVWRREARRWVRMLANAVFVCVVVQGLLGGGRVLANDPRMAMVHGNFAAVIFCLMGALSLVTSRRWHEVQTNSPPATETGILKPLAVCTTLAIYGQFILGGRIRHLHDMLHEHLAGAVLASVLVLATVVVAHRSRDRWLRAGGCWMLVILLAQLALGAGAWVTRFGFATTGYVATPGSPMQVIVCSGHTVVGVLLLMTSVVLSIRVQRVAGKSGGALKQPVSTPALAGGLSAKGGVG